MQTIDTWVAASGHRLMIAGDFMALEDQFPAYNVPHDLDGAWNAGYVPFVNLEAYSRSSTEIANGAIDAGIRNWAHEFAKWSNKGQKRAFLAPLQEMNGDWTPWHVGGPTAFIAAYRRIRTIFEEELAKEGVPSTTISWVFAPNGATPPEGNFELWYPGSDVVDIVGFSAYNYAGCPAAAPWLRWEDFDFAIRPYLDRMRALVPNKPVFVTQTATLARAVDNDSNPLNGNKNGWLNDTYTKAAAYPGLRGVIYYNWRFQNSPTMPNCPDADFRLHNPSTGDWQGFRDALANPASNFVYYAHGSANLSSLVFARPEQIFADVVPIHPLLAGEPGLIDWTPWVHTLYRSGITSGCGTNPLRYCPDAGVTRGQMAVFLLRALRGSTYSPPAVTNTRFADVPATHAFASWIEAFADTGITSGCGTNPLRYCPDDVVTRGQMAVFLMRATQGQGYVPPPAQGMFSDVPTSDPFAPWIEALAASAITGGCGGGRYCPNNAVTRAQMAVFLVRAFGL